MQLSAVCPSCSRSRTVDVPHSIDASTEMKARLLDGSLFVSECPYCGKKSVLSWPLLYHDTAAKLMFVLTDASLDAQGLPEGYVGRIVSSAGELIEKVKIFDAGLDDVVMELVKYVTRQEMESTDAELRFLKLDGADSEIIFSYPKDGRMEMLSVGFNVYQDCLGIVSRNPAMHKAAEGLSRVNSSWISAFLA